MTSELASWLGSRNSTGLRDFWSTYLDNLDVLEAATLEAAATDPVLGPLSASMSASDMSEQRRLSQDALERAADGDMVAYAAHLTTLGMTYASLGVAYASWFRLVRAVRCELTRLLVARLGHDAERMTRALDARDAFLDWAMATLGDAYIATKEAALRRSEARFRCLMRSGVVGVVIGDGERPSEVNEAFCEMVGYRADELVGAPERWRELTPPRHRGTDARERARLESAGETSLFETAYRHRDGREVPVLYAASRVSDDEVVALVLDMSDQKQLERLRLRSLELEDDNRRIQEANRLKSEFLASMSHELRTPLNAIIGIATLLHDGVVPPDSDDYPAFLGDLVTSGEHLLQLVNDVLDLSRVEAGKLEFYPEICDPAALAREVVSPLRTTAAEAGIEIGLEVDDAPDTVELDPSRFKQVLYNYLSNAVKFSGRGGRVDARLIAVPPGMFRVEVTDYGIGIAPEDIGRLFQEFEQLDAANTAVAGTGLGLALTRRLVEAQGGRVGVRSELGVGSTFVADLPCNPVAQTAATDTSPLHVASHALRAASAPYILVVDDDAGSRRLMAAALAELHHAPVGVESAAAGLELSAARPPHAVVLDLVMPGTNGFVFLEAFRALPGCADVPVIVWSIKDLSPAERAVLDEAGTHLLPKGRASSGRVVEALAALLPPGPLNMP